MQREIIKANEAGAGQIEDAENGTFRSFLVHNEVDPLLFTEADYATLTAAHGRVKTKNGALVGEKGKKNKNKTKIARLKGELETAYDQLKLDMGNARLKAGVDAWDRAVRLGVERYNASELPNTDASYQTVAEEVWPIVGARDPDSVPASFWKAVKTACKSGHAAAAAPVYSAECDEVYTDMDTKFKAWDKTTTNRGAWWGTAGPGQTGGAKDVPSSVVVELKIRLGSSWQQKPSFSGGVSFHRQKGDAPKPFIYHMLAEFDDEFT